MFIKFDRFEDEATARWIEAQAPEHMESGAISPDLIIVSECMFGAECAGCDGLFPVPTGQDMCETCSCAGGVA